MIIRLTDSELEAVFTAARPLHPRDRDAFLQAIAAELATLPVVSDGPVQRVASAVQRLFSSLPAGD